MKRLNFSLIATVNEIAEFNTSISTASSQQSQTANAVDADVDDLLDMAQNTNQTIVSIQDEMELVKLRMTELVQEVSAFKLNKTNPNKSA